MSIESVDVFHVLRLESEGRLDELADYLSAAIERIANAGAEVGALCANTPHIVFDELQARSPIPLISIVDACRDEARRRGFEKLGLLGTAPTMEGDFYHRAFAEARMELVTPSVDDRRYVAGKISEELEFGILREDTRVGLASVVRRMRDAEGIQAVVLGCTELPPHPQRRRDLRAVSRHHQHSRDGADRGDPGGLARAAHQVFAEKRDERIDGQGIVLVEPRADRRDQAGHAVLLRHALLFGRMGA